MGRNVSVFVGLFLRDNWRNSANSDVFFLGRYKAEYNNQEEHFSMSQFAEDSLFDFTRKASCLVRKLRESSSSSL